MTAILAFAENYCIGWGNNLPWPKNKADLQKFKELTSGKKIIVGKTTYLSLPRLKDREIYVLSSKQDFEPTEKNPVIKRLLTPDEAPEDALVCGGAQVYEAFADKINHAHATIFGVLVGGKETYYLGDTFLGPKMRVRLDKGFVTVVSHCSFDKFSHYIELKS